MSSRRNGLALLLAVALPAAIGCAEEEYPAWLWNEQHPPPVEAGVVTSPAPVLCAQAHAVSLPARLVAMSSSASSGSDVVLVSDIFQRFASVCGACHGPSVDPPGQGGFQIQTASEFRAAMTPSVLAHVTSSVCPTSPDATDPHDPMPPCSSPNGGSYAQRGDTDPVKEFAVLVQQWQQAGSPLSFTPPTATIAGDGGKAAAYRLTPADGNAMTDIGNCVPDHVAFDDARVGALDKMFAGLQARSTGTAAERIGLPEHLAQTDLFTLDSAVLARYGVTAYAPAYPLWTDNAGKLRYVRVPKGASIAFDKITQQFTIPPNTRFYKTFLKQIVDTDGSYRYRKIETRVIVSRPDESNADGTVTNTALFGTYKWNDDESDAVLVETPLNDGQPFADTLFLYNTDEPLAADVLRAQPADPQEALLESGAARHYAIPSSQRCIQCHMGSPSESFVLGFTPLQIRRRETGQGGVIEPAGPDELTQLKRLVDAGIVSGVSSASDILPLERSQGDRAPRNEQELVAQGYVLGNCAHCHNPRGYPTVQSPVLRDVLDFLPSTSGGGLFQFPLERYSPRIGRGPAGLTPIPYITPSLVDLPRLDPLSGQQAADIFVLGAGPQPPVRVDYAPWRSLVYRNVDAAFAYTDDLALYPHMPFNSPGYDPRAKRILSDWMVSIPAVRKHPELLEYAYQTDDQPGDNQGSTVVDWTPQPYAEIPAGAPPYAGAVAAANERLQVLHSGVNPALPVQTTGVVYSRYADPGRDDDIVDPTVSLDPICHPVPGPVGGTFPYPLPEHAHWVNTDLSDPPGPWQPRQANWTSVLVEQQIPAPNSDCTAPASQAQAYADQVAAVGVLPSVTLSPLKPYATTPVPFGLWQVKSGCKLTSQPTVSSFTGAQRPHWMDVAAPPPDAPVYSQSPGEAVFKMICINCHGPRADANGRLAQNLATMTGGLAAVADFRDGLFGPTTSPDANIHRVFGALPADASTQWTGATPDDRAARYMAWMALGGTSVNIPVAVLQIVAVTRVLDHQRVLQGSQLSANMLSQAKALCLGLLGPSYSDAAKGTPHLTPGDGHGYLDAWQTSLNGRLIPQNGDAELWLELCSLANPPPVHILKLDAVGLQLDVTPIQNSQFELAIDGDSGVAKGTLLAGSLYPPAAAVGNERGGIEASLSASNEWPWCVDDTGASSVQETWLSAHGVPVCPAAVKSASRGCALATPTGGCFGNDAANRWAVRGAINAGLAVFLYAQSLETMAPPPDYNQCELLK